MNSSQMSQRMVAVLSALGPTAFLETALSLIFSVHHYYLLGKSLGDSTTAPAAGGRVLVPLCNEDIARLHYLLPSLSPADRKELLCRLFFYEDGFRNCYLMKDGEEILYLQWIIFPSDNTTIEAHYSGRFLPLGATQVMIENAFTFPRHRGKGCLRDGTLHLLRLASENGYRSAICYIRKDRISSLNEFVKMGFHFVKLVTEYKLFGRVWRTL